MKGAVRLKRIVAVYTGKGLAAPLEALFKEHIEDCRFTNIIDDSIIHDVIQAGVVTKAVIRRLIGYYQAAADMGADLVLNTCSSVGEVVDIARNIISVPILKIDEPMAKEAVENFDKIAVLATLPSTLNPTIRLIQSQAKALNKNVQVFDGLADGAYQALISGKPQEHDRLILEAAERVAGVADCIVLAQGSMGRMQKELEEKSGKTVLASPPLCVRHIKSLLGG